MTNYQPLYGGLAERKRALIRKLSGQNNGAGGAARLSAGTPFGALPRLGYNPSARSVFGRPERFNYGGAPEGLQGAIGAVSGTNASPSQGQADGGYNWATRSFNPPSQSAAPTTGVGPSAGAGSGSPGLPQGLPTFEDGGAGLGYQGISSNGFSGGNDGGTRWLMGSGGHPQNAQGATGAVPLSVQNAIASGTLSSGVSAWLTQNPWFLNQLGLSSGGGGVGGI